jgi:hypothetical protein
MSSSSAIVRGLLSARKGKENQIYRQKVQNEKFTAPKHELDMEKFLTEITPRNKSVVNDTKAFIEWHKEEVKEEMRNAAIPNRTEQGLAKLMAWEMWELQLTKEGFESQVNQNFTRDFYAWLKGCGTEEDHQKTPWGRQKVVDDECKEYLMSFTDAKLDYMKKLQSLVVKANVTNLVGLQEHYMYFKYIVRGGWENRSEAEFMFDYNELMCCRSKAMDEYAKIHSWDHIMNRASMKGLRHLWEDWTPGYDHPRREDHEMTKCGKAPENKYRKAYQPYGNGADDSDSGTDEDDYEDRGKLIVSRTTKYGRNISFRGRSPDREDKEDHRNPSVERSEHSGLFDSPTRMSYYNRDSGAVPSASNDSSEVLIAFLERENERREAELADKLRRKQGKADYRAAKEEALYQKQQKKAQKKFKKQQKKQSNAGKEKDTEMFETPTPEYIYRERGPEITEARETTEQTPIRVKGPNRYPAPGESLNYNLETPPPPPPPSGSESMAVEPLPEKRGEGEGASPVAVPVTKPPAGRQTARHKELVEREKIAIEHNRQQAEQEAVRRNQELEERKLEFERQRVEAQLMLQQQANNLKEQELALLQQQIQQQQQPEEVEEENIEPHQIQPLPPIPPTYYKNPQAPPEISGKEKRSNRGPELNKSLGNAPERPERRVKFARGPEIVPGKLTPPALTHRGPIKTRVKGAEKIGGTQPPIPFSIKERRKQEEPKPFLPSTAGIPNQAIFKTPQRVPSEVAESVPNRGNELQKNIRNNEETERQKQNVKGPEKTTGSTTQPTTFEVKNRAPKTTQEFLESLPGYKEALEEAISRGEVEPEATKEPATSTTTTTKTEAVPEKNYSKTRKRSLSVGRKETELAASPAKRLRKRPTEESGQGINHPEVRDALRDILSKPSSEVSEKKEGVVEEYIEEKLRKSIQKKQSKQLARDIVKGLEGKQQSKKKIIRKRSTSEKPMKLRKNKGEEYNLTASLPQVEGLSKFRVTSPGQTGAGKEKEKKKNKA